MELIGIEMSEFTRRARSILLNHSDLALDRGLEPGERVVLWDALSGDYHSGTVADIDFSLEDTHYRFEIGIRLPEDLALDRITGMPSSSRGLGTREVFALLQQLRADAPGLVHLHNQALER
ncbi:hypothetical protein [Nocardioides daejeonensis]|uniref:hypothetical protein n=1 Tax=Nocardioides daejeonensis TaxID=1046556 RepID=UPI000D746268|nr:hypothetical protein [Nocardioides daejeonensis]